MAFELILLGALILIFIFSFCGLLQKIKQTYQRERLLAERLARRRERLRPQRIPLSDSYSDIYINPVFNSDEGRGVFPTAPPPYSQYFVEPPPKYDEAIKVMEANPETNENQAEASTETRQDTEPPPYVINLSSSEATRH